MKSPCTLCEFRRVGCHNRCPAYEQFRSRVDIARENERKDKEYSFTGSLAFCLRRVK